MNGNLLATKLHIPTASAKLVPRPRLIAQLAQGLARPLTLISAPAGFGKTTLMSAVDSGQWAVSSEPPTVHHPLPTKFAWYSLDGDDNDLGRFLDYLIAALATAHPTIGQTAQALLQSSSQAPSVLTSLINDLVALSSPVVLVLDDYHVITNSTVHDAVSFLIDHLPPTLRVVILTRATPPLPLARWRARDQLVEITAADLRFTPDEATAFLNRAMGLNLSPQDIATLDQRTEGWIASLQLAALTMQGQDAQSVSQFIATFSGTHRYIMDYLTDEVLNRQSEATRAFLLQTSILDRMCGSLCDAVWELEVGRWRLDVGKVKSDDASQLPTSNIQHPTQSQQILEQLEQSNLFVVALDHERRWYRYHHLFADMLRTRLAQTTPELVPELHRRASEWYRDAGLAKPAIDHAFAIPDLERVAGLIDQFADRLNLETNQVLLSKWMEQLPHDLIRKRPWLCVYAAWVRYWTGQRDLVESSLRDAERALAGTLDRAMSDDETRHLLGHIAAIRSHYALTNEELARVLEMGQKALDLLPAQDHMRCEACVAMGGAHWGQGNTLASQESFHCANTFALQNNQTALAVSAACYVSMIQVKRGLLDDAFDTLREALNLATIAGKQTPIAGFANVKLGDLLRERNELESARQHIETGVEQCVQLGQADVLADGYVTLARFNLACGNLRDAREALRQADEVTRRVKVDPFVMCWLDDCRVRLWLVEGNLDAAAQWASTSGLKIDGPLSYHYDLNHINLARVWVVQGIHDPAGVHLAQALQLLDRLHDAAQSVGWIHEMIKILILKALALQASHRREQAQSVLAQALTLAQPAGYKRVFVDEGAPMRLMIADFRFKIEASPLRFYAANLLAGFKSEIANHKSQRDASQSEILSAREREVLQLVAAGKSYQAIAQELIVALSTVQWHIKNIYQKLDAHSGLEAVARANSSCFNISYFFCSPVYHKCCRAGRESVI